MQIIFLDFETYYDPKSFTLSKMTTEEYVRDPRFEALCVSVVSGGKGVAIPQQHLPAFFKGYDWSDKAVCAHHAQFDGLILSHHFGIKPKFWFDTISMARIVYGPHQRVSLAKLLELHGMQPKTIDYNEFAGKRWHQMGDRTRQMLLDGAVHDGVQTEKLFYKMLPGVPTIELAIIDKTIRTFTEPHAEGDLDKLRIICNDEVNRKEEALHELRVKKADLASADTFIKLLTNEGIEVEYKESKTIDKKTGLPKMNPCFAKSDPFMQELLDHENPRVRALAETRLDVKSTLNETRAGRMLRMTERGPLTIYLNHAGTHTLRPSGGEKMNWLNLPRGGELRKAIKAPPGKKISVKDYNAFELRLALYVAGQSDKLKLLTEGGDIYCDFGTTLYGRPITKADERERYISKQVVLGSQYRQGDEKLHRELNHKHKVSVPMEFCSNAVHTYRKVEFPMIGGKDGVWKQLDRLIPHIANKEHFKWKMFEFKDGKCYAPNGSFMFFENIEWWEDPKQYNGGSWRFEKRKGMWVNFHGGILFENLIQFLQRCMASEALVKMPREMPVISWPYDEFVNIVHDQDEHDELVRIMEVIPDWIPGMSVKVEGGIADVYEK
jgi:hypothetical protein